MKILIIDREPIVRSTLREFLQDAGHDVSAVEHPNDLSTTELDSDFDATVVLTETQQPACCAQSRIDTIAKRFPRATIYEMDNAPGIHHTDAYQSNIAGVFGRLRKPIRLAELEIVLNNLGSARTPEAGGPPADTAGEVLEDNQSFASEGGKP